MSLFCSCTKSNYKKSDNILDMSIHNVSLIKDKKINQKINDNCNILSIFNVFWCEPSDNELIEDNKDLFQ